MTGSVARLQRFGGVVACAASLALSALPGCKRSSVPKPLVVEIKCAPPLESAVGKILEGRVAGVLAKSELFEIAASPEAKPSTNQPVWRCRVEVGGRVDGEEKEGMLRAVARIDCGPKTGASSDHLVAQAIGDKPHKGGDIKALLLAHLEQLTADTAALIVKERQLRTGSVDTLIAAIHDKDADVRRTAIRAAGIRGQGQADKQKVATALIPRLDDSETDIRDMALGALLELRDPAAVKAIATRVRFENKDELRKVIAPIAAIGGKEARDFLSFVASGHEDPDIRKQAEKALESMK